MASFAASSHQQRPIYLASSSSEVPCPEALGYVQGKTIGSGTYAKVKAAWSPYEQKMIAIRTLRKTQANRSFLSKFLPREIDILQLAIHPNILQVYRIIETEDHCYFIVEIAENGDLLDYINARIQIPEDEARYLFKQMTSAINFCHSIEIVHRDLKCENVMLNKAMQVKIGDFGFAARTMSLVSTPCGSLSYAAPELFSCSNQKYDGKKADTWSLGVILYSMVNGYLPFEDDCLVKKPDDRTLSFSRHLSSNCKNMIQCILNPRPEDRYSSVDILRHTWLAEKARTPASVKHQAKYTFDNCLSRAMARASYTITAVQRFGPSSKPTKQMKRRDFNSKKVTV